MEIADSARKPGIADHDIRHAVQQSIRAVRQDADRVLFIGPDCTGALLEVVMLDSDTDDERPTAIHAIASAPQVPQPSEVMTMPRTREQLEQAAADAERWLDQMDPAELNAPEADSTDLRRIGLALSAVAASEAELAEAVRAARANGRSWSDIGMVLGISRQAARTRFNQPAIPTPR